MPRGKRKEGNVAVFEQHKTLEEEIRARNKIEHEDISTWPLENMRDYIKYNEKARELNHKLGLLRYPIKPCPAELHPQETVVLSWTDGRTGDIPICKSDHMIDFDVKVTPGKIVKLPRYIVNYLQTKSVDKYERVKKDNGEEETIKTGEAPRITVRTIYDEGY